MGICTGPVAWSSVMIIWFDLEDVLNWGAFIDVFLSIHDFDAMIFEKAYFYLSDRVLTKFRFIDLLMYNIRFVCISIWYSGLFF